MQRLIAAAWFGTAVCLVAIATPAAFRASPTTTVAANIVGAMLTPWHYLALSAPLLLLLVKRDDKVAMIVLTVAILFSAAQAITDTRIRAIRISAPVPISALPPANPLRRRFGLLHGLSSLLLLGEAALAGIVVARR